MPIFDFISTQSSTQKDDSHEKFIATNSQYHYFLLNKTVIPESEFSFTISIEKEKFEKAWNALISDPRFLNALEKLNQIRIDRLQAIEKASKYACIFFQVPKFIPRDRLTDEIACLQHYQDYLQLAQIIEEILTPIMSKKDTSPTRSSPPRDLFVAPNNPAPPSKKQEEKNEVKLNNFVSITSRDLQHGVIMTPDANPFYYYDTKDKTPDAEIKRKNQSHELLRFNNTSGAPIYRDGPIKRGVPRYPKAQLLPPSALQHSRELEEQRDGELPRESINRNQQPPARAIAVHSQANTPAAVALPINDNDKLKKELIETINKQIGGWFSSALVYLNIFVSWNLYCLKQLALQQLKENIEKAEAGKTLNDILTQWKTGAVAKKTHSSDTVKNEIIIGKHRNSFFSYDRPGKTTETEDFIHKIENKFGRVIL